MTTYIQTAPQHGLSVLHVEGCRKIHHKVARVSMESFSAPWDTVCDTCIRHGDPDAWESDAVDQRAAWQKAAHEESERRQREFDELMLKGEADRYEAMHEWLPLRDWLARRFESVSVRMYRDGSTNWKYAPIFEFSTGWPVKTIGADVRMTCDGTSVWISNVFVASAARADQLAQVLFAMEHPEAILSGAHR